MQAEWLESVSDIRPRGWDSLTGDGDLFRCCDWLEITAASDPDLAEQPRYLMVFDDAGQPAAATPVYVQVADKVPDPLARVDLVLHDVLTRSGAPRQWSDELLPSVLCGGWVPYDTRVILHPGQATELHRGATGKALDELAAYAGRRDYSSIVFLYVDEQNHLLREALTEHGYIEIPAEPRAVMDIDWPDFAGYLASLPRKGRQSVRADERRLAAADVVVEVAQFTEADVPLAARLALGTASKYEPDSSLAEMERWLETVARQQLVPVRIVRARLGDRVCGFMLMVEWRGVLYSQHGGFDYAIKGNLPVYFGVVFYAGIRYAIDRGLRRIEYSLGSSEVKKSRGCSLPRQRSYVRVLNPDTEAALRDCLRASGLCESSRA